MIQCIGIFLKCQGFKDLESFKKLFAAFISGFGGVSPTADPKTLRFESWLLQRQHDEIKLLIERLLTMQSLEPSNCEV